jgi:hypothetical protein
VATAVSDPAATKRGAASVLNAMLVDPAGKSATDTLHPVYPWSVKGRNLGFTGGSDLFDILPDDIKAAVAATKFSKGRSPSGAELRSRAAGWLIKGDGGKGLINDGIVHVDSAKLGAFFSKVDARIAEIEAARKAKADAGEVLLHTAGFSIEDIEYFVLHAINAAAKSGERVRDAIIRVAKKVGFSKKDVHEAMGIARKLGDEVGMDESQFSVNPQKPSKAKEIAKEAAGTVQPPDDGRNDALKKAADAARDRLGSNYYSSGEMGMGVNPWDAAKKTARGLGDLALVTLDVLADVGYDASKAVLRLMTQYRIPKAEAERAVESAMRYVDKGSVVISPKGVRIDTGKVGSAETRIELKAPKAETPKAQAVSEKPAVSQTGKQAETGNAPKEPAKAQESQAEPPKEGDVTGIAQQIMQREPKKGANLSEMMETGRKAVEEGRVNPSEVAAKAVRENAPLTEEELHAVNYNLRTLGNRSNTIAEAMRKATDPVALKGLSDELDLVTREVETHLEAAHITTYQSFHRIGMAAQVAYRPDYSLAMLRARAKGALLGTEKGIPDSVERQLADYAKRIGDAEAETAKAKAALEEALLGKGGTQDATKIAAEVEALQKERANVKASLRNARKQLSNPEFKRREARLETLDRQIAERQAKLQEVRSQAATERKATSNPRARQSSIAALKAYFGVKPGQLPTGSGVGNKPLGKRGAAKYTLPDTEMAARKAVRQLAKHHATNGAQTIDEILGLIRQDIGANVPDEQLLKMLHEPYRKYMIEADVARIEADRTVRDLQRAAEFKLKPKVKKVLSIAGDLFNTTQRSMQAGMDISAPFIQGRKGLWTNPSAWVKAWGPMMDALKRGDKAALEKLADIKGHPIYAKAKAAGLELTEPGGRFTAQEEMFATNLLRLIDAWMPGSAKTNPVKTYVKALEHSDAAYSTFLNHLRFDTFQRMAAAGVDDPAYLRDAAMTVNILFGRGHGQVAKALGSVKAGNVAYAPRYWWSELQYQFGSPLITAETGRGRVNAMKVYAGHAAYIGTVVGLARLAGWDVETDIRSSTFGRAKIGKYTVDLFGKDLQAWRVLSQMAYGKISMGGNYRGPSLQNAAQTFGQYTMNKSAPGVRTVTESVFGVYDDDGKMRKMEGEDMGKRFLPLWVQQALETGTFKDMPTLSAAQVTGVDVQKSGKSLPRVPLDLTKPGIHAPKSSKLSLPSLR